MIVAITSHFVYQYWSAFWIVSSTSSFKGRITAEVEPPLPLYRALRKRAGCATTKSCRTSWLNWENPQTSGNPWDVHLILHKSGQSVTSMSLYHHHFIIFPHTRQPSPLGPTTSDCSQTGPIIQSGEWWQKRPKRSAPEMAENWKRFWCHFLIFCFIRFNPARQKQSRQQTKNWIQSIHQNVEKPFSKKKTGFGCLISNESIAPSSQGGTVTCPSYVSATCESHVKAPLDGS